MTEMAPPASTVLSRLVNDRSGNTLAIVAAAIAPLLAITGSAVDIGRGYVTESRLQQACDAGVLAARKRLGSDLPPSDEKLADIKSVGNEFFDLNFPDGRYGSTDRTFVMTLEPDFAITGEARTVLPTAIMQIFGKDTIDVDAKCQSRLNFTNLDVMMVLDVTGSMRNTNDGDTAPRLNVMRDVVKSFHGSIEASKSPDTRVRYGFLPYATNVNVGGLLRDDWVATNWNYQSRESQPDDVTVEDTVSYINATSVSGTKTDWTLVRTYPAIPRPGFTDEMYCAEAPPPNTYTEEVVVNGTRTEPYAGPPSGTQTIVDRTITENGTIYRYSAYGNECRVERRDFTDHVYTNEKWTRPTEVRRAMWRYTSLPLDVSSWRDTMTGCIEERDTYQIDDYSNVDLTRALDLDIDLAPTPGVVSTQWRPQHRDEVYARKIEVNGNGTLEPDDVVIQYNYAKTGNWWQSHCPAPASKLSEMTASDVDAYLSTLQAEGATYHDIGMIWGARLLSPDGLFAADNADTASNKPTSRHMIFLTDGQTEAYDIAYGAYGIEPLDRRRWDPETSTQSLVETIEARFRFACNQIKKKNTTVWIIAFGTTVNPSMTECAGQGRYFEAQNAAELNSAFSSIARSMGDLRISE